MSRCCPVCGAGGEPRAHFGGSSCRACAAFFRRYVRSTKLMITCTCKHRNQNSHPCRHCRMMKCIETGMSQKNVQFGRDKHSNRLDLKPSVPPVYSSISLLKCRIIPRESPNIFKTISNWKSFDEQRAYLLDETMSIYDLTCFTRTDCFHISSLFESIFPELGALSPHDKEVLISNLLPKWIMLESAVDYAINKAQWDGLQETRLEEQMILNFYGAAIPEEKRPEDRDILRIFKPFWSGFYYTIGAEMAAQKLDQFECTALYLLIMFDNAYSNLSDECSEMCHRIRKVILGELRAYQIDQNCEEARFFDTIDALSTIEKAEQRFEEEILVCEMNNVRLHDDFRKIMDTRKI